MRRYRKLSFLLTAVIAASLCMTVNAVDVPSIQAEACVCDGACTSENIDGGCPVCRANYRDCLGTGSTADGDEFVIHSFDPLSPDILRRRVGAGTDFSILQLPASLQADVENSDGELESVMLAVVWQLDPSGTQKEFSNDIPGEYHFIPLFSSRYSAAEDMELPEITVTVEAEGNGSEVPSSQSQAQSNPPEQTPSENTPAPLELRFEKTVYEAAKGASRLTPAVVISGGSRPSLAGTLVLYLDNEEADRNTVTTAGTYPFSVKVEGLLPGKHVLRADYTPIGELSPTKQISAELEIKGSSLVIQTMPSAANLTYGQLLEDSLINPGTIVNGQGAAVKGEFQWKNPEHMPETGPSGLYPVVFVPDDVNAGEAVEMQVQVGVRPAPLTITEVSTWGRIYDGYDRLVRCTISFEGKPENAEDDRIVVMGDVFLGSPKGGGVPGNVGTYEYVNLENLSLAGQNAKNYTLEGVVSLEDVPLKESIQITPAKLTVSLKEPLNVTMGDLMPELSENDLSFLGLVPGETIDEIDFEDMEVSFTPEITQEPGTGEVEISGLQTENYTIVYVPGEVIIEEKVFEGLPYDVEGERGENDWFTGEVTITPNDTAGRFHLISVNGGRTWDDSLTFTAEGEHTYSIMLATGKEKDSVSVQAPDFSYKLDTKIPELGRIQTNYKEDVWTDEDVTFTLSCSNSPTSPVSYRVRIGDGEWSDIDGNVYTAASAQKVEFKAVSECGQESVVSDEYDVKIDKGGAGKPSLEGASQDWIGEEAVLNVIAPSPMPESGIQTFAYSIDGGKKWSDPIEWEADGFNRFIIDEDGDYTDSILVRIVTNVGKEGTSDPYSVKLDSSRPAFEVSAISDGEDYEEGEPSEQSITFTIVPDEEEDIPSGVTYYYSIDDSGQWTALAGRQLMLHPTETTQQASYSFKAVSGAGTESKEKTFQVFLYRPSFTPVKISAPVTGWTSEQVTITADGGLPEEQLEGYEYCVTETAEKPEDDAEWDSCRRELNVYREMDYYFWYRAVSLCGTKGGLSDTPVHLQIDRTAPYVRQRTIENLTENSAVISLESGEEGEVYYLLESGEVDEDDELTAEDIAGGVSAGRINGQANVPLTGLESGEEYTVFLTVKDRAGNFSSPSRLSFMTKPPVPEGVLVEIDYIKETIAFSSRYELNADPDFPEDGDIPSGSISEYIPDAGEDERVLYLRVKAEEDVPASDPTEVVIPARPESSAAAEIDYYAETVALPEGMLYSFDGEEYEEADGSLSISDQIPEDGERLTLFYRSPAAEDSFAGTPAGLNIPARPSTPPAPAVKDRAKDSITLDGTGEGIYYRCGDGKWQKDMTFRGLTPSTSYTFEAYTAATEQSFASKVSQSSEYSTLFSLPEEDQAVLSYEDETISYDDRNYEVSPNEEFDSIIEDGESISKYIPAAGSLAGTLYIRAKGDRDTPPSEGEAFSIPARPEPPVIRTAAGLYTVVTVSGSQEQEEFYLSEVKDAEKIDWDEVRWRDSGSFQDLDAGTDYILYARVAAGDVSFRSETVQIQVRTMTSVTVQADGAGEQEGTASVLVNGTPLYAAEPGDTLEWKAAGSSDYTPSLSASGISGEIAGPFREGDIWIWRYTVADSDQEIEGIVRFDPKRIISIKPVVQAVSLNANDQANESITSLQDYMGENVQVRALYDNGSWEDVYAEYTLSKDSDDWEAEGGEYLFTAYTDPRDEDVFCTARAVVHPVPAALDTGGDIFLTVNPEGYSLSDIPLPDTAKITYSTGETEEMDIQWERPTIPEGFGTYEGRLVFTGEVELPAWAMGDSEFSLTVSAVKQQTISDSMSLLAEGWEYGEEPKKPEVKADISLNGGISYTYSGTAMDGTALRNSEIPPEKAGVYTVEAVYRDEEQTGCTAASFLVETAALTVASADIPRKAYDGQTDADTVSITLDGLKNGDELVLGRDFETAGVFFDDAEAGGMKNASGTLILNLARSTANYRLENSFQAVGEITAGEGIDNPAYQSTRALMDELHIITNRTPVMEDVKLPKGWSFAGDTSEKLLGDSQSAYQTFTFRYTSSDSNYADVAEEIRVPVTTVSASVDGGGLQMLHLDTLGEAERLPRVSVAVWGASIPGKTPSADDFYWLSKNSLVRVEDAYATPMGDGIGLLELRYEGSSVPAACLLLEIDSGSQSKNTLSDIMEIAEDISSLLNSGSNSSLKEEEREILQTVTQGISRVQDNEKRAMTLKQAKLLDEFQQKGLNITLQVTVESAPGMPAPESVSAWGLGTAAKAEANNSAELVLTPIQPTGGAAMEMELELRKNRESLASPASAFFLQLTLPESISADSIGEIHQAKGERASDWEPVAFQKDGQIITIKLDSLSKFRILAGGSGEQTDLDANLADSSDRQELPAAQTNFWNVASDIVRNAEREGLIRVNAKGFDRMPVSFMEALEENPQVSVLIQWNGGENILIPAGTVEQPEPERSFYPLTLLEEKYQVSEDLNAAPPDKVWSLNAPDEADVELTKDTITGKDEGLPVVEKIEPGREEQQIPSESSKPVGSSQTEETKKVSAVPLVLAGILAVCLGAVFALKLLLRRRGQR